MTVIDKLGEEAGHSISRAGAWAVLACGLILSLLLALYGIGSKLLPPMTDFIATAAESTRTNAESMQQMSRSMVIVHEAHAALMQSAKETQQSVKQNGEQILLSQQSVEKMLRMMDEAYRMMANAPEHRSEQIDLLQKIDQSIQQLRQDIAEQAQP